MVLLRRAGPWHAAAEFEFGLVAICCARVGAGRPAGADALRLYGVVTLTTFDQGDEPPRLVAAIR